ncbi:MAG: 30S ribosomal protein S11 [Candidatus Komeilibacteria bacterium]|nr:30S ribosomal protein S11 [Candidatus Komeilibacteria bacterium]
MSEEAKPAKKVISRKKAKKKISIKKGVAYINATYNNTIISLADTQGNILAAASAGKVGFKGPKKSTPYAAGVVVRDLAEFIKNSGLQQIDVVVKGVGMGREAAIRALSGLGLQVLSIKDRTSVPHNGPRAPRPRRI